MSKTMTPQDAAKKIHALGGPGTEFGPVGRKGEKELPEQHPLVVEFRAAETRSEMRACMWMALGDQSKKWFMGAGLPDFPRKRISAKEKDQGAKYAAWLMECMGLDLLIAFAQGREGVSAPQAMDAIEKFAGEYPIAGVAAKYYIPEHYAIGAMAFAYKRFMGSGERGFAERTFSAMDRIRSKEMDPYRLPHMAEISEGIPDAFLAESHVQWRARGTRGAQAEIHAAQV